MEGNTLAYSLYVVLHSELTETSSKITWQRVCCCCCFLGWWWRRGFLDLPFAFPKRGGDFFFLPSTSLWGFYLLTCIHPGFPMHTYCIAFWFTFCVVALQRPRARSRGAPTLTLEQIAPVLQWAPHCPLLRGGASSHFSVHEAASLVPQTHRLVTRSVHVILHDWRGSAGARSALC